MSHTSDKLAEAGFFLAKLDETHGTKEFDYYLNAFIASARSVLWVMRAEYSKKEGWEAWYQAKEPTDEEARLLRLTRELRNTSEKVKPLRAYSEVEITIPKEHASDELVAGLKQVIGERLQLTISDEGLDEIPVGSTHFKAKLDGVRYKVADIETGEPILGICHRYHAQISDVVYAAMELFGR